MEYAIRFVLPCDCPDGEPAPAHREEHCYGRDNVVVHTDIHGYGPLIELYDAEYAGHDGFDAEGQFVCRYYVRTLREGGAGLRQTGLNLDDGIPKWRLTPSQTADLLDAIERRFPR